MSITIVVLVSTLMAVLIGAKIYFEHRQEQQFEKAKAEQDAAKQEVDFVQEEIIALHQPIIVEQPKAEPVEIQDINSAAALAEVTPKPKKKKRYYGKPKPKPKIKATKK